jgi:hypothetical protein
MNNKTTTKKLSLLTAFINDFRDCPLQVRDIVQARKHRVSELRTKKNNHLAIAWDGLNAFVLCNDGFRRQLFINEINRKY